MKCHATLGRPACGCGSQSATCTLGISQPQGRVDRALGGLPPGWRSCPPAQPYPCQTVQSIMKALTVHSENTYNVSTVQHSAIHNEFTHNEQYSALQ